MKTNIGPKDKLTRVVIAFAIGLLYLFDIIKGTFGIIAMIVAIILLLTSFFNFCPLYSILGKNTLPKNQQS